MIRALEAAGLAWLMFNGALLVLLRRDQAMQISRETIDRFKRAIGVCETNRQPAPPMPDRRLGATPVTAVSGTRRVKVSPEGNCQISKSGDF